MKKYLLGLMSLALLGASTLLGQAPTGGQKAEPIPAPVKEVPIVGSSCPAACCPKTKTICCPEHYCKKTEKVTRTFGSEKKCLPPCHGLFGCHKCDDDHAHCGHAICTRYLIKKVEVCEKDAVKCVPVEVQKCNHRRGCANGTCSGAEPVMVAPAAAPPVAQPVSAIIPNTNK